MLTPTLQQVLNVPPSPCAKHYESYQALQRSNQTKPQQRGGARCQGHAKIKERVRNKTASPGPQSALSLGAPGSLQGKAGVSSQPSKRSTCSAVGTGPAALLDGATECWSMDGSDGRSARPSRVLLGMRKSHIPALPVLRICPCTSGKSMNSSTSWWHFYERAVLTLPLKAKLTRSVLRVWFGFKSVGSMLFITSSPTFKSEIK